jgi:hypothetical protein
LFDSYLNATAGWAVALAGRAQHLDLSDDEDAGMRRVHRTEEGESEEDEDFKAGSVESDGGEPTDDSSSESGSDGGGSGGERLSCSSGVLCC